MQNKLWKKKQMKQSFNFQQFIIVAIILSFKMSHSFWYAIDAIKPNLRIFVTCVRHSRIIHIYIFIAHTWHFQIGNVKKKKKQKKENIFV